MSQEALQEITTPTDSIAPTIAITSPANSAKIGTRTTIAITARDNVAISRMQLLFDGNLVTTVSGSALTYTMNTRKVASGTHTILARAFDAAGNMSTTTISVFK